MFWPWNLDRTHQHLAYEFAGGYLATAVLLVCWELWQQRSGDPERATPNGSQEIV
jgi:hypothetical protein